MKSAKARSWLCTLNLNEEEAVHWKSYLGELKARSDASVVIGQLEKGEETHHPHIQFFIHWNEQKRLGFFKKLDKRIHAEPCKSESASIDYVTKEETRVEGPFQDGELPFHANEATDWEKIWELAKNGEIDKIPPAIRIIHYNKLKQIAKDNIQFQDSDHLRGIWIWGKPGTGKSRWVRDQVKLCCKSLYPKLCNKWWDGYQGEKIVVMDDIGPQHECLAQQLKIWTDRYDAILETKGSAVHAQYDWFIVTSQYSPSEIFKDEKDLGALKRRFQVYEIKELLGLNLTLQHFYNNIPVNNN